MSPEETAAQLAGDNDELRDAIARAIREYAHLVALDTYRKCLAAALEARNRHEEGWEVFRAVEAVKVEQPGTA